MLYAIFIYNNIIIIYNRTSRGGEVFRERPLKKLFGTLWGFSAYRADAGGWYADECCFLKEKVKSRFRGRGIWIDISVVRFLPLSFYAKKKVAERKARIRGGGAKDARIREHMAAPVPPLMYLPL